MLGKSGNATKHPNGSGITPLTCLFKNEKKNRQIYKFSTAGPLQLKGAAKQNIGKKNSKLAKFCNDEATVTALGPIPGRDSKLFAGLCFLLTCTEPPRTATGKVLFHFRQFSC